MSQIGKEAVAGVWPVELGEAHVTQTFPSISASGIGRFLGLIFSLPFPIGFMIHLLTVPIPVLVAITMFFFGRFRRYQLTSTRVRIRRGIRDQAGPQVLLSELEDVRLVVRPGQTFYRAADLELVSGGRVALTLAGVPVADAFRHNIIESRDAFVQVLACQNAQEATASAG